MSDKPMPDLYVKELEGDDWDVHIDGEGNGRIEWWSSGGDKVVVEFRGGRVLEAVKDAYEMFDVDEYVMQWIGYFEEKGARFSVSTLVDDARRIREQFVVTINHLLWAEKHK